MDGGDSKSDMNYAAASAISLQLLCDGGRGIERLQQLDRSRAVADLQQHFTYLVAAEDFFAMDFAETHGLVDVYLLLEFAGRNRHRYVVD
jgi:hypothetical protein